MPMPQSAGDAESLLVLSTQQSSSKRQNAPVSHSVSHPHPRQAQDTNIREIRDRSTQRNLPDKKKSEVMLQSEQRFERAILASSMAMQLEPSLPSRASRTSPLAGRDAIPAKKLSPGLIHTQQHVRRLSTHTGRAAEEQVNDDNDAREEDLSSDSTDGFDLDLELQHMRLEEEGEFGNDVSPKAGHGLGSKSPSLGATELVPRQKPSSPMTPMTRPRNMDDKRQHLVSITNDRG